MSSRTTAIGRLALPAIVVAALVLLWWLIEATASIWAPSTARVIEKASLVLLWLAVAWLADRLLDAILWRTLFSRHVGHDAPRR